MSKNIIESAKASLESTKGKINEAKTFLFNDEKKEIIELYKGSGQEKIKETIKTFNDHAALFKQSGYELSSINAGVSIPHDISISFNCLDSVPVDDRLVLLAQTRDNKIAALILKSLFKASDFALAMKMGELTLKSINVKLGLIPGISVSFS
jgi:hypothetical protein